MLLVVALRVEVEMAVPARAAAEFVAASPASADYTALAEIKTTNSAEPTLTFRLENNRSDAARGII
jgi:hypothetical protein